MKKNSSFLIALICLTISNQYARDASAYGDYFKKVHEASQWLKSKMGNFKPKMMITLSCGIDKPIEMLTEKQEVIASEIPYFPIAHAEGHEGKIIFGNLNGEGVALLKGRFHYYEGLSPQEVVFPYFVLHELGVRSLITVNAVGGIREDLNPGDIMLVKDQINTLGENPLRGIAIQRKHNQFTDMTNPYDLEFQQIAKKVAQENNIKLKDGIYLATMGPSYETKAEIGAFRRWGADAVGMSTVFEVITCRFLGMRVLAFCAISNPAADRHTTKMSHDEVIEAMHLMAPKLSTLITNCAVELLSK